MSHLENLLYRPLILQLTSKVWILQEAQSSTKNTTKEKAPHYSCKKMVGHSLSLGTLLNRMKLLLRSSLILQEDQ